jgi:NAD(P)-dependent dehydrogenase (short-subunit alcohol dehydrogenase family)
VPDPVIHSDATAQQAEDMTNSLTGKVVLITGGARGIGAATARELVSRGASVALLDQDGPAVKETAGELGERAAGFEVDVTDVESLDQAVSAVVAQFGGIDVVVANAGIAGPSAPVATVDPAAFERVIEINLLGVWRTVRAALPHVMERKGYVLVVASVAAALPMPTMAAYGASKAGVHGFGRALRLELAPTGTAAGVAYFGIIDTDMVHDIGGRPGFGRLIASLPGPAGKAIPPSQAADAIVRGIERRSASVYAPGYARALVRGGPLLPLDSLVGRMPAVSALLQGKR